jgi:hypothetical protein
LNRFKSLSIPMSVLVSTPVREKKEVDVFDWGSETLGSRSDKMLDAQLTLVPTFRRDLPTGLQTTSLGIERELVRLPLAGQNTGGYSRERKISVSLAWP